MLEDQTDILTSYEQAKVGMNFTGFVLTCKDTYCLIKFYNGVVGILLKKNTDPSLTSKTFMNMYKVGKSMKVFVLKSVPSKNILQLTLKDNSDMLLSELEKSLDMNKSMNDSIDMEESLDLDNQINNTKNNMSGFVVNILSYDKPSETCIELRLAKSPMLDSLTKKKKHTITKQHFSDYDSICDILSNTFEKGGKKAGFDNVAVLGRINDGSLVLFHLT